MDLFGPLLEQSFAHPGAYSSELEDFDDTFNAFLDDFVRTRDASDEYVIPEVR